MYIVRGSGRASQGGRGERPRKWKRHPRGAWELWDGDFLLGICERSASYPGCWWWSTWGLDGGDRAAAFAWGLKDAKRCVEKELENR